MNLVVLGPVPCKGCRMNVYWGHAPLRSHAVGELAWRNVFNHRQHFCKGGLRG